MRQLFRTRYQCKPPLPRIHISNRSSRSKSQFEHDNGEAAHQHHRLASSSGFVSGASPAAGGGGSAIKKVENLSTNPIIYSHSIPQSTRCQGSTCSDGTCRSRKSLVMMVATSSLRTSASQTGGRDLASPTSKRRLARSLRNSAMLKEFLTSAMTLTVMVMLVARTTLWPSSSTRTGMENLTLKSAKPLSKPLKTYDSPSFYLKSSGF